MAVNGRPEAFRAAAQDGEAIIREVCSQNPVEEWSRWRNNGGQDLVTLCKERAAFKVYAVVAPDVGLPMELNGNSCAEPRQKAFRAVVQDDMASLAMIICGLPPDEWFRWQNRAGKNLLTMSQERKSSGAHALLKKALKEPSLLTTAARDFAASGKVPTTSASSSKKHSAEDLPAASSQAPATSESFSKKHSAEDLSETTAATAPTVLSATAPTSLSATAHTALSVTAPSATAPAAGDLAGGSPAPNLRPRLRTSKRPDAEELSQIQEVVAGGSTPQRSEDVCEDLPDVHEQEASEARLDGQGLRRTVATKKHTAEDLSGALERQTTSEDLTGVASFCLKQPDDELCSEHSEIWDQNAPDPEEEPTKKDEVDIMVRAPTTPCMAAARAAKVVSTVGAELPGFLRSPREQNAARASQVLQIGDHVTDADGNEGRLTAGPDEDGDYEVTGDYGVTFKDGTGFLYVKASALKKAHNASTGTRSSHAMRVHRTASTHKGANEKVRQPAVPRRRASSFGSSECSVDAEEDEPVDEEAEAEEAKKVAAENAAHLEVTRREMEELMAQEDEEEREKKAKKDAERDERMARMFKKKADEAKKKVKEKEDEAARIATEDQGAEVAAKANEDDAQNARIAAFESQKQVKAKAEEAARIADEEFSVCKEDEIPDLRIADEEATAKEQAAEKASEVAATASAVAEAKERKDRGLTMVAILTEPTKESPMAMGPEASWATGKAMEVDLRSLDRQAAAREEKADAEAEGKEKDAEVKAPEAFSGNISKKSGASFFGMKHWDARYVEIKDQKMFYWKSLKEMQTATAPGATAAQAKPQGKLDLSSTLCEVLLHHGSKTQFTIRPKAGTWGAGSFAGAETAREFEFDVGKFETEHSRDQWVQAINAHIEFAHGKEPEKQARKKRAFTGSAPRASLPSAS